jgi:hypothetical protein
MTRLAHADGFRLYALYERNIYVLLYLSIVMSTTVALGAWEFSYPGGGRKHLTNSIQIS